MTERRKDNELFTDLKRVINHALPLEYAIRATQLEHMDQFIRLKEIDQQIRQHWLSVGAQEWMLEAENLVDLAWDVIQVGIPLVRRHGRCYHTPSADELAELAEQTGVTALFELTGLPELAEQLDVPALIARGLSNVRELFGAEVAAVRLPVMDHFRICDLLNGNHILDLLCRVAQCLNDLMPYKKADSVKIAQMVRGVREPIRLLPGVEYVSLHREEQGRAIESFGMVLDLERDVPIADLKRQLREFVYQLAVRKQEYGIRDRLSHDLIEDFLRDEQQGRVYEHKVQRIDGFLSPLIGLYCWDLAKQLEREGAKAPLQTALDLGLEEYAKHVRELGPEVIKKHYYTVDKLIQANAKALRSDAES